jgi:hypothetical protein
LLFNCQSNSASPSVVAQSSMDEFSKRQDRLKNIVVNYDQKIEEITRYRDGVSNSDDTDPE